MEQLVVGIVIILLSMGLLFLAISKRPFGQPYIDFIFSIFAVILVAYAVFRMCGHDKMSFESFDQSNITRLINNIRNTDSTQLTTEKLSKFSSHLTIYYSAFSRESYPTPGKKLYNISPYFSSPQNACPDIQMENTYAYFTDIPSYSPDTGFALGLNKLTGPMSHQLGVNANDSFSIFFAVKFDEFELAKEPLEIFKMYANTPNNNGLSLTISNDYKTVAQDGNISLVFEVLYGTNSKEAVTLPSINVNYVYLFFIIKNGHSLILNIYPNITDISSSSSNVIRLSNYKIDITEDVLLSNKEMIINQNKNILGHLYNFGIFNRAVTDQTISDVYINIQDQLQKYNQTIQSFNEALIAARAEIAQIKQCPYDKDTCNECSNITDWTNTTNIIMQASSSCMAAIHKFCKKNTQSPLCTCWNPNNIVSSSESCRNYKSIFSGDSCFSVDNINANTLEIIKQKNGLCDCTSLPVVLPPKPIVPKVIVPKPKLLDNNFYVNTSDIDVYNAWGKLI